MLQLMVLGINDVAAFDFIDKPSPVQIIDAIDQLVLLGAIESNKKTVYFHFSSCFCCMFAFCVESLCILNCL